MLNTKFEATKTKIKAMKQLPLSIFIFLVLLLSSCGGYMIETGLSKDRGTLNPLNGSDGASGVGGTMGIRYKRMLRDANVDGLSKHGVGFELMYHLNGYGTEGDSNPFFYRSISGRYYYLIKPTSQVKCYFSGSLGFGGQKVNRYDYQPIALLGSSLDIHFFKKEFIYVSPKINYIQNLKHGGNSLSVELTFGIMLRWQKK
jgi:hypothetical protein